MDNFDELDEPVISSSGRKKEKKLKRFHRALQKQRVAMVREKLCV